jgi:hypothetical protein
MVRLGWFHNCVLIYEIHETGWLSEVQFFEAYYAQPKRQFFWLHCSFIFGLGDLNAFHIRGEGLNYYPGQQVGTRADHENDIITDLDVSSQLIMIQQNPNEQWKKDASHGACHTSEANN